MKVKVTVDLEVTPNTVTPHFLQGLLVRYYVCPVRSCGHLSNILTLNTLSVLGSESTEVYGGGLSSSLIASDNVLKRVRVGI